MIVVFKKSFLKEIKKIKNKKLNDAIFDSITNVENAYSISEIKNLKPLTGFKEYYRIRIGDYRIGLKIENDSVYFVTVDHRKDIYKAFP